ncbi:LysR substrate-binding domain-containing protein [Pseudomonas sp. KB-10]|uniref:LysR substrate-binding domain-containing protein n=1 Tax=Pseudomonadaceae TaxID=135621 RepID=UPI0009B857F7
MDIVDLGFDAGVRLRNAVPADMIAVPLSPPVRFLTVASPSYLAKRPPESLRDHDCIRHRLPSGKRYRWEFERSGVDVAIDVPGQLTLNSNRLMVKAAIQGMGIAYVPDFYAEAAIKDGLLETILGDWCPAEPGLALYYSGHRQVPAVLRAFIDLLKETQRSPVEIQEQ